ncbi:MAG TPA: PLP-dependent aminotransferase family protein, partial [Firmicutes bacterium]|nr:PLP-dependent aminotransferase family protein [Bacillota bacterium]
AEMSGELDDLPKMRWEPFYFNSEFFGMPHSRQHEGQLIRFTQASPDPALFPFDRIKQIATTMLWYPKEFFFDVGNPQGYRPLVDYLEKEMALAGVPVGEEHNGVVITGGFRRALSLVLDLVLRPGQKVVIESPNKAELLNLLIAKRVEYIPVPMDAQGMDTEYLAGVLAQGDVRAVITSPTYHNPTGTTMSQERREHLIRLAAKHRVPIIEDDWGRMLSYEGVVPPPLKSLDPGDYVIHIGTFSKAFLPGLRIGWVTVPAPLAIPLVREKLGVDREGYFLQALLHEFISKGYFAKHLRKTVKEYKRRRNAMAKALKQHVPEGCSFATPNGGFTFWLELPAKIQSLPMLTLARAAGVEYLPASFCMPDRKDTNALRLSFSRTNVEEIETGIENLCKVIVECIKDPDRLKQGAKEYEDLYK